MSNDNLVTPEPQALLELISKPISPTRQITSTIPERGYSRITLIPVGTKESRGALDHNYWLSSISCSEMLSWLIAAFTGLVNRLLSGRCPDQVCPNLFGGILMASKIWGLCQITMGYFWHWLASKCTSNFILPRMAKHLTPIHVSMGCSGRCKAAVHLARCFLANMPDDQILVNFDLTTSSIACSEMACWLN